MFARSLFGLITLVILTTLTSFIGCKRDLDVLSPVAYSTEASVFVDGFGPGVQFAAFGDSKLDALSMDNTVKYDGMKSLKITVPNDGDKFCTYPYAGGVLVSAAGRNLSGYNQPVGGQGNLCVLWQTSAPCSVRGWRVSTPRFLSL